jgi:hypothetical protein
MKSREKYEDDLVWLFRRPGCSRGIADWYCGGRGSSMNISLALIHWAIVLSMPILLVGLVNRTKSWWVGRKGPRLFQSAYDLWRLLGKRQYEYNCQPFFLPVPVVLICLPQHDSDIGQFASACSRMILRWLYWVWRGFFDDFGDGCGSSFENGRASKPF